MTRALITDPTSPPRLEPDTLTRSPAASVVRRASPTTTPTTRSGCGHAAHGSRRSWREPVEPEAATARRRRRRTCGLTSAAAALAAGHEVILVDAASEPGGQLALAARGPARSRSRTDSWRTTHGRSRLSISGSATKRRPGSSPTSVPTPSSWQPAPVRSSPTSRSTEISARRGTCSAARFLADSVWSSPTGAAIPPGSTPPRCSSLPATRSPRCQLGDGGESVHQYRRNLYLQRLYRAGARILPHLQLADATGGEARFRNVFAPELETSVTADTIVLALGRIPVDSSHRRCAPPDLPSKRPVTPVTAIAGGSCARGCGSPLARLSAQS